MRRIGTDSMHYRWSLIRTEDRPSSTSRSLLLVLETQFETTPQGTSMQSAMATGIAVILAKTSRQAAFSGLEVSDLSITRQFWKKEAAISP
jgi:hypothetical protein